MMMDSDLRQTIEEYSLKIGCIWCVFQNHFRCMEKMYRQGIRAHHKLIKTAFNQWRTMYVFLLSQYEAHPFLQRLVIENENRVLNNNPDEYIMASSGRSTYSYTSTITNNKEGLCVWWRFSRVIHYELHEPFQTVIATVYCDQLEQVKQKHLNK
ncbi:hypothetical protein NPIL_170311 [Nephila pilipes]|uniref:Uncharacterized protein n=1 Tax=Nephila pilipes TaxID=299642 RepID=A0A8X6U1A1_NEPPI|nr:hypothetical protein NPIL_170311 [Nephila pilipes]